MIKNGFMKRNYRNQTIVDFQGKTDKQIKDSEKMGCFSVILFAVLIIYLIASKIF
jgi:hypothetical protein